MCLNVMCVLLCFACNMHEELWLLWRICLMKSDASLLGDARECVMRIMNVEDILIIQSWSTRARCGARDYEHAHAAQTHVHTHTLKYMLMLLGLASRLFV